MPILKHLKQNKILLDTHVWLWIMMGNSKLKKEFNIEFEKHIQTQNVLISPMSVWEIGMLVEKKRIELEVDVQDWVDEALDNPGIKLLPLTPKIAIQSVRLPGHFHGDPVDRLLVATAHLENAVLVTCDQKILSYGEDKFLFVYHPSE